jgi:F0F1-type ATP synthase assembly protein I
MRRRLQDHATWVRQIGLLTTIPFVLLAGPAVGYYVGSAIDARWSCAPWGLGISIALGLAASARVTIQLIRQARDLNHG